MLITFTKQPRTIAQEEPYVKKTLIVSFFKFNWHVASKQLLHLTITFNWTTIHTSYFFQPMLKLSLHTSPMAKFPCLPDVLCGVPALRWLLPALRVVNRRVENRDAHVTILHNIPAYTTMNTTCLLEINCKSSASATMYKETKLSILGVTGQ